MRQVTLYLPPRTPFTDPAPAETARREVRLRSRWTGGETGVIGWSSGGWKALALATEHPVLVDRLVLVSTAMPADKNDSLDLDAIQAKTLLLYGSRDELTGAAHARWWQKHLPNARIEMVQGGGHDILARVWPRVLSHVAPGAIRTSSGR